MNTELASLQAWATALPGIERFVLRPRVLDERGRYRSVDALAVTRGGVLVVVDVWWPPTHPRRHPESGRLEHVFDRIPVDAPDPEARLLAMRALLARLGGTETPPVIHMVLLAPALADGGVEAARQAWSKQGIEQRFGEWPATLSLPSAHGKAARAGATLFSRVALDPREVLSSPDTREGLAKLTKGLGRFLESRGADELARQFAERWRAVAKEPLRVALLGRFSSGKSTFLNAMTGPDYEFPTSSIPTTAQRVNVTWGREFAASIRYRSKEHVASMRAVVEREPRRLPAGLRLLDLDPDDPRLGTTAPCHDWAALQALIRNTGASAIVEALDVKLPLERLRSLVLIDLPGTDSAFAMHKEITRAALADVDAALYFFLANQPYNDSDHELLGMVSARMNLSDASRYLFLANLIDLVDARERPAVIARLDAMLQYEHGIERPAVAPTCMFLAGAQMKVGHLSGDMLRYLREDVEDALLKLDLDPHMPIAEAAAHSGLPEVLRFLEAVASERELWKTRALLERTGAVLNELIRAAELEKAAVAASAERVRSVRNELEQGLSRHEAQLGVVLADRVAKLRATIDQQVQSSQNELVASWSRAVDVWNGKDMDVEQQLQRIAREVATNLGQTIRGLVETLRTEAAASAQLLLVQLQKNAEQHLLAVEEPDVEGGDRDSGFLMINWVSLQASGEPEAPHVSFSLADELFALSDSFTYDGDLISDVGKGALAMTAKIGGFAVKVVERAFRLLDNLVTSLFGGSRPDPLKEKRDKLRDQVGLVQAEKLIAPLAQQAKAMVERTRERILEAFRAKAHMMKDELSRFEREKGEDGMTLAARRRRVEDAIASGERLRTELQALRGRL